MIISQLQKCALFCIITKVITN